MQRSEINALMDDTVAFLAQHRFMLPRWALWSAQEWRGHPAEARYLREHQMGWDITDFGSADFRRTGLILFCLRNGRAGEAGSIPYAEKIMVVRENQETPFHHHKCKQEDIINRGGGVLVVEMHRRGADGRNLSADLRFRIDGIEHSAAPDSPVRLLPGESITIDRHTVHRFYGEAGKGRVLVGEVSQVNDDLTDNYFESASGRFAAIDEDAAPRYPLWNELAH